MYAKYQFILVKLAIVTLLLPLSMVSLAGAQSDKTGQLDKRSEAIQHLYLPFINNGKTSIVESPDRTIENPPTDQIIIKYVGTKENIQAASEDQLAKISQVAGVDVGYFREMSGDAHVLKLPTYLPDAEVQRIAVQIEALPEVEYAEANSVMQINVAPNDPDYPAQWHYVAPTAQSSPTQVASFGINLPAAWDVTTGDANLRIAVIDTGILFNHPDMQGRTVAGYDFISNSDRANDNGGRDNDASDPGDWVTQAYSNTHSCGQNAIRDSLWHGTHVAGTIGAATDNNVGVAGVNWRSQILPVRVLGRCGGDIADIVDGMRWAAGLAVANVPNNPNPARILNLSLGADGTCGTAYQDAINDVIRAGAVVVVAAGNEGLNVNNHRPANCNGVITVAATDRDGDLAWYSNWGSVAISAPGGETNNVASNGILSTLNAGTQGPTTHTYTYYEGTSMATPHVAGVASLILSVRPALTATGVLAVLQQSVTPFPSLSTCATAFCGAGILNAENAVRDIYIRGNYVGNEFGFVNQPFNTFQEGYDLAWSRAKLRLQAGTIYHAPSVLSKPVTIVADGGVVVIEK